MYGNDTILVVGQAKPSREDAIYNLHGEFYISLVVEKESGRILDVECNTILSVTRNFIASIFIGKSLRTDLNGAGAGDPLPVLRPDAKTTDCLHERCL